MAHPDLPDPAQCVSDPGGADVADHGLRHPQRRGPVLHRAWRAAADAGMGHHGRRRLREYHFRRMVDRVLSRRRVDGRGVLLQSARGRLARPGRPQETDMTAALSVEGLSVEFRTRSGIVRALDNVSFSVDKGETIALVGESGSGKSVTAYAVMGILDPAGRISGGHAMFGGLDLLAAKQSQLAEV